MGDEYLAVLFGCLIVLVLIIILFWMKGFGSKRMCPCGCDVTTCKCGPDCQKCQCYLNKEYATDKPKNWRPREVDRHRALRAARQSGKAESFSDRDPNKSYSNNNPHALHSNFDYGDMPSALGGIKASYDSVPDTSYTPDAPGASGVPDVPGASQVGRGSVPSGYGESDDNIFAADTAANGGIPDVPQPQPPGSSQMKLRPSKPLKPNRPSGPARPNMPGNAGPSQVDGQYKNVGDYGIDTESQLTQLYGDQAFDDIDAASAVMGSGVADADGVDGTEGFHHSPHHGRGRPYAGHGWNRSYALEGPTYIADYPFPEVWDLDNLGVYARRRNANIARAWSPSSVDVGLRGDVWRDTKAEITWVNVGPGHWVKVNDVAPMSDRVTHAAPMGRQAKKPRGGIRTYSNSVSNVQHLSMDGITNKGR